MGTYNVNGYVSIAGSVTDGLGQQLATEAGAVVIAAIIGGSDSLITRTQNTKGWIYNVLTGGWSQHTSLPFSDMFYDPENRVVIGARNNLGNPATIGSGNTFDGAAISASFQTGYMDFGALDEIKEMPPNASEGIKRLRAFFSSNYASQDLTLTVYTEENPIGKTFTISVLRVLFTGSTASKIGSREFIYTISATDYTKALNEAGTNPLAQTIPQNTWGLWRFEIGADGVIDVAGAANNTTGYATEALAIAALPVTSASHVSMGYVTVRDTAAAGFVGQTTAFNAATVTANFYNADIYMLREIRTALSRDIRGRFIAFRISNNSGADFLMSDMGVKITPRAVR